MITKPTSRQKLKELFLQLFLSNTSKVSKVSKGSVVDATAHGISSISQRILKDIAVIESNIFPESAFGTYLDDIALRNGIPARFSQIGSTTFIRLFGDVGTTYLAATNTFTGNHGIVFELLSDVTIGSTGIAYAKVSSTSQGKQTNVDSLTITRVLPSAPIGHSAVLNEFTANGGQDNESDDIFRNRIKRGVNQLATGTLALYEQVFQKINSNVLSIYKGGYNASGKLVVYIATVNGVDLNVSELQSISDESFDFLSLSEQIGGLELRNINYEPIDVSLRVELELTADADTVRKTMQVNMQRVLDWRTWEFGNFVEWEDLAIAAKQTTGVKRVLDNYFTPSNDIQPLDFYVPRIRSFTMYDIDGVIISDATGVLSPTFFPNQEDFLIQQTLISSI
ncbi:baseplate J/gp47 family protein [bacterium]|nr:baseplate J/gp47 family protein [bacterium]